MSLISIKSFQHIKSCIKTFVLFFASSQTIFAGTVTLDTTFNSTGYCIQFISTDGALGESVGVQNDGKIVLGGWPLSPAVFGAFAALRLNANGTLDTSFSGDGIVTTQVNSFNRGDTLLLQPDGKILLSGDSFSGISNDNFTILRYNSDGNLDNSFDGNGIATPPISGFSDEHTYDMAMQSDGKIVMVGKTAADDNLQTDLVIMRLNTDGSLDTTFNGTGILVVTFQNVNESANAVAIQNDGKIIIGGFLNNTIKNDYLLMRFNPNGFLDTSFGTGGLTITSVSGGNNSIDTLALQSDGKILAGGTGFVARYTSNGVLDKTFGNNGIVSAQTSVNKILIRNDDKFLVGGTLSGGVAVSRYNPNGSLDSTFNNTGTATSGVPGSSCTGKSLAIQGDSKIILGGYCTTNGNSQFAVFRFNEAPNTVAPFDFDGDRRTDLSVFRPSSGQWWLNQSNNGLIVHTFGNSSDKLTPGDFTGDGKTDVAIFRPSSGEWFVLRSENFTFYSFPFGSSNDVPAPNDYDGDGKTDAAVFRPSDSTWYIQKSSGGTTIETFGATGDQPVSSDYDGDGKADLAIYRANSGQWWLKRSTAGLVVFTFGTATDKTFPGDYTGDGKADVAFWRPTTGEWFILRSENASFYSFPFGASGDLPVPGDYDGDGKWDAGVFRSSTSTWYINRSTAGVLIQSFGLSTDFPVPSAFTP